MTGNIFDIKRFAVHDGPGIRTTIFFKGCPLKCIWCHNPESLIAKKQLGFLAHKCVCCGKCAEICPQNAHILTNDGHSINREACILCGKCVEICPTNAMLMYGCQIGIEEALTRVLEDRDFYDSSNGGVTLSGGECLMQAEFCAELLKRLKDENIHTAVDTCGFVTKETLNKIIPYTDLFLYDIKAFDEDVHIKCTGQSNKIILENLKYLNECNKKIEIRIPLIPTYNDDQIEKIAEFLKPLKNVVKVRILPYHNYAASKYESIEMINTSPDVHLPTEAECNLLQEKYFSFL